MKLEVRGDGGIAIPVASLPVHAVSLTPDPIRDRIYALTESDITVIDTRTLSVLRTIPGAVALAVSADASRLWMSHWDYNNGHPSSEIASINLDTFSEYPPISVNFANLSFSRSWMCEGLNGQLYIGDRDLDGFYQVDLATGTTKGPFGSGAVQIQTSADLRHLLVWDGAIIGGESVHLSRYNVSGEAPLLESSITRSGVDANCAFSDDGSRIWITINAGGTYGTPDWHNDFYSPLDLAVIPSQLRLPRLFVKTYNPDHRVGYGDNSTYDSRGVLLDNFFIVDIESGRLLGTRHFEVPATALAVDRATKYLIVAEDPGYSVYNPNPLAVYPAFPPLIEVRSAEHCLTNVSTRMMVGTGDKIEIGGFIIAGNLPKKVLLRAVAPSLTQFGVRETMANPILDLYDAASEIVATNDNWNTNRREVLSTGYAPGDEREGAIVTTLKPGSYTAILRGFAGATGVALFELYDLDPPSSKVPNISTRGNVGIGDDVMIAGFIIGGNQPTRVIVRALGPALADFGVDGALADPTLELHNGNGAIIGQNDDWKSTQQQAIQNSGYAPPKDAEAAIMATLQPGNYTAIVRGKNDTTGVALVEVYNLDAN